MSTLLVIGGGILGEAALFHLSRSHLLDKFSRVVQWSAPTYCPPCSLSSMAVVGLRGTQKGLTPLGDCLVDAYELTNEIFLTEKFHSISEAHLWMGSNKAAPGPRFTPFAQTEFSPPPRGWKKTPKHLLYEKIWFIDPAAHLVELQHKTHIPQLERSKELLVTLVKKDNKWWANSLNGEELICDQVLLCTGAGMEWMKSLIPEKHEASSLIPVKGSFYQWENLAGEWGERESFSVAIDKANLIWNQKSKRLWLGASAEKGQWDLVAREELLRPLYDFFANTLQLDLPSLKSATRQTGLRVKAARRLPIVSELQTNLWMMNGAYKNGWSFGHMMAKGWLEGLNPLL